MSNRFLTLDNGALTSTLFSARSQALENFTAAGVPLYPAGAGVPKIGTPAEVRSAIGLGSLATRDTLDVGLIEGVQISKSYLTNSSSDGTYLYLSKYALMDRLAGANSKYNVVYQGSATNVNAPFDGSSDSSASIPSGSIQSWEIDFSPYAPWTANGYNGYVYERGGFVLSMAYGVLPANLTVEVYTLDTLTGLDGWVTRINKNTGFIPYKSHLERLGFGNYLKKMRISVTAPPTSTCYVSGFEYFPEAPDAAEDSYALGSSTGAAFQRCHTPIIIQNAGGGISTTLGKGSLVLAGNPAEATSTTTGALQMTGIGMGNGAISVEKRVQFTPVSAASQPNLSLFVDSATGKLSFKDSTGTVNVLY
jgi:hypothetical protein